MAATLSSMGSETTPLFSPAVTSLIQASTEPAPPLTLVFIMKKVSVLVCGLTAALLAWTSADAHTDVPLKLVADGKLVADSQNSKVPLEFQPLEYLKKEQVIRIGKHRMKLAPYFQSLFPDDEKFEVHFSASWYHDLTLLPPYMLVHIKPSGRQFSYRLLLNLKDLSVIQFSVEVELGGRSTREFPVDLRTWKEVQS